MESIINYYYGIICNNIIKKDDYYIIESDNNKYLFAELIGSIEEVQNIIDILNRTNIKYHLLVLTKDGNNYITYEEKNYCLLKIRCNINENISLLTFETTKTKGECSWSDIWSQRVDYYEEQVEEVIKDESIKYVLQYYIGLTEIGIYYHNVLKDIYQNSELIYTISHKKISSPKNLIDYFNPLNMIIDLEIRDLAEYFKASYFNDTLTEYELLNLIDNFKFSEPMANYFYLRLLYPSYFFNLYDKYIEDKELTNDLIECIKKSKDYESLLSKVYSRLKTNNDIKIKLWFFKFQHL